jgi:hypothetical protein
LQTLGTYATPGPIVVTTGFNLIDAACGGSTTPGPRTLTPRTTDNAGNCSTLTLALT